MSSAVAWIEAPVARHHRREEFDCGVAELNAYLALYARQNHASGGAKTFVAAPPAEPTRVLGYYSICPAAIAFARIPARLTQRLGRYEVPVFRLGRLAVSHALQGKGLGAELVLAAGIRALSVATQIGGVALAIDAKDKRAADWYRRLGAMHLLDDPLQLILPLEIVAVAVAAAKQRPH